MIPAASQVVGAGETNVLVAGIEVVQEGLILRGTKINSGVKHLLTVIVAGLRVTIGAQ